MKVELLRELPDQQHLRPSKRKWLCRCGCGNSFGTATLNAIKTGHTKSCGCIQAKRLAKGIRTSHSMSNTRIYNIWCKMKERCYDPNNNRYHRYGAIGIKVCDRWSDFVNFYADMGEDNGLTLERKDTDGDYEPNNCKWATQLEQQNNRSNNIRLTYGGRTLTLSQWGREPNTDKYHTMKHRIYRGWSDPKEILFGKNS